MTQYIKWGADPKQYIFSCIRICVINWNCTLHFLHLPATNRQNRRKQENAFNFQRHFHVSSSILGCCGNRTFSETNPFIAYIRVLWTVLHGSGAKFMLPFPQSSKPCKQVYQLTWSLIKNVYDWCPVNWMHKILLYFKKNLTIAIQGTITQMK